MSIALFVFLAVACLTVNCKLTHKKPPPPPTEMMKFDQCMDSH